MTMGGFVEIFVSLGVRRVNMITVLVWLLIHLLIIPQPEGKLLGDHVCQTEITVPQEVFKWELKNRTTRTYKWCMSVPPRCSVYSSKVNNETKISVINTIKSIEACCEGFKEQNNFCISQCQNCQNGLCIKQSCVCQAGWEGTHCDFRTISTTTGYTLSTDVGADPKTTTALQELSTHKTTSSSFSITSINDEKSTYYPSSTEPNVATTISSTQQSISTSATTLNTFSNEENSIFPKKHSVEPYSTSQIPSTTIKNVNGTTRSSIQHPILEHMLNLYKAYVSTTTENPNEELEGSGSRYRSKNDIYATETPYFDTTVTRQSYPAEDQAHFESNENSKNFEDLPVNVEIDYRELNRDIFEESVINTSSKDSSVEESNFALSSTTTSKSTAVLTKPSTIEDHKEENAILKENVLRNIDDFIGERYEKHSSVEMLNENTKLTITESASKNLIYSICAASLTTFLILVVVVTLYAVRNSRKKVEKNKEKKDMTAMAVYTTSIFHSPLPDPPTFDNPTYLSTGSTGKWNKEKRQSIEVQEFNVVFQKPMKNPKLDCKHYVYDHPPSTGSYRASSEVDTLSQYNFSQKSLPGIFIEPLYDEIPAKDTRDTPDGGYIDVARRASRNDDNSCLYMNTCGRTQF